MDEIEVKERPSEARINEAVGLNGVQVFAVTCPKDVTMFQDAVKTTGQEDRIVVMDLIELVHEAM
jgi:Fe-S oxidoreductase